MHKWMNIHILSVKVVGIVEINNIFFVIKQSQELT